MASAPRRPASAETRSALLDAAARVFSERGLHGATVRQIAKAAGFTNPVLYYHFGGKEDLYDALIRGAFEQFKAVVVENLSRAGNATGRLHAIASAYLSFGRENPRRLRILYSELLQPQGADPELGFDAQRDWVVAQIEDALHVAVRDGIPISDVKLAQRLFVALLGGLLVEQARDPGQPMLQDEGLDRLVVELFLHGISRAQGAA